MLCVGRREGGTSSLLRGHAALPPTVVSGDRELRHELGRSPMERLERSGELETLHVQYRMPPALVEFPSKHFYRGVVKALTA